MSLFREVIFAMNSNHYQTAAIERVKEMGGQDAGDVLVEVARLREPDWLVCHAAEAVGMTPGREAVEALLELFHTDKFHFRVTAAASLNRLGQPGPCAELLPRLQELLASPDGAVRRDAVDALKKLNTPAALPLLTQAMKDPNGDVRYEAVSALEDLHLPEITPLLEQATQDPYEPVVRAAKSSLWRLKNNVKRK